MTLADTGDSRYLELKHNLSVIRRRIEDAKASCGRTDEVALMVVTKFHPLEDVVRLAQQGVREFGENRAQEAQAKVSGLSAACPELAGDVRWNFIGQIQSKKAPAIAEWAGRVHSVASAKVADGLNRGRQRAIAEGAQATPLQVLVQISLDDDTARGGISAEEMLDLAGHVESSEYLQLTGLMVVPPLGGDPLEDFRRAQGIHSALVRAHPHATEFSAGMSHDLESAVQAGSTCVRVGTAILGARPLG